MVDADDPAGWLHHPSCWGCGPRNPDGLHLVPRLGDDDAFHAEFTADDAQHGPPGRLHGGLLAVPMDCLSSWAAIHAVRERARGEGRDPSSVVALTGGYEVRLHRPTPTGERLRLRATVADLVGRKVRVHVEARHEDVVTATFEGLFVEVPTEPATRAGG